MVQLNLQAGHMLRQSGFARLLLLMLVLLATSMIIGDGVLTPAISVISAISGIEQASPNITNSENASPPPIFRLPLSCFTLCPTAPQQAVHLLSYMQTT